MRMREQMMGTRVEFYVDRSGSHRWRAVAANGQIVATGHQGYSSKQKAEQGLEATRKALGKKKWRRATFYDVEQS
jgi:uncharacterized protein YegP (UPF0339 family)